MTATAAATPAEVLVRRLQAAPVRFRFTQAVAILQAASPAAVPIGFLGPPEREAVRLRPALELGFPSADLARLQALPPGPAGARTQLECTFFGLYGQASPLPAYVTEALLTLDDPAPVRDFLDLFHHRLLSLAYRVLTKYRLLEGSGHLARLLALIGHGATDPGAASTTAEVIDPGLLLTCAGLMAQQPRSAAALERVLAVWLQAPVAVDQCVARWLALEPERQCHLGQANCALGVDTIAGSQVLDRATSFRIRVGPVGGAAFRRLLPGGPDRAVLEALVAEFNGGLLAWELQVEVAPAELPEARLGGDTRLGWDTRLPGGAPDPIAIPVGGG